MIATILGGTMATMVTACGSSPDSPTTEPVNQAPTAVAGNNQNVASGAEVTLDGSRSSDPEDTNLTYAWSQIAGPNTLLEGTDKATLTFTAPTATIDTTLTFRLTVTDAQGATDAVEVSVVVRRSKPGIVSDAPDACSFGEQMTFRDEWFAQYHERRENERKDDVRLPIDPEVLLANASPTANAGEHRSAMPGEMVTLDGSGSSDRESTTLGYAWHQISGPRIVLDDAAAARPTFTAPPLVTQGATLTFRLTVADEIGEIDRAETQVNIAPLVQRLPDGGRTVHVLRGHAPPPFNSNERVSRPSISADGRLVAGINWKVDRVWYVEPKARVWSAETGELLHVLNHGFSIQSDAKLSPDGRFVITGGFCEAMLWDTTTGERLRIWDMSSYDHIVLDGLGVTRVGLSARGHVARAHSSSCGPGPWLWDAATDERLLTELVDSDLYAGVSWVSPDGKLALTRSVEGVHIWDVATATELHSVNLDGRFRALSADGGTVLATSWTSEEVNGRSAQIIDTATGRELCELRVDGSLFERASLSADGTKAWTVSDDGGIRFWDVAACAEPSLLGHHKTEHDLAISDDGRIALTVGDEDGLARLWSMETGGELHVLRGHEGVIREAVLSADGRIAVTTGDDKTARVWNVVTGEQLRQLEDNYGGASVESVALSGDGSRALTGGGDLTARLWNADTGEQMRVFDGHEMKDGRQISSVVVTMSADGRRGLTSSGRSLLYSGNYDARLWDTSTGRRLNWTRGGGFGMALSADGATLLTGHSHGRVSVSDTSTNERLRCFYGDFDAPMLDVALDAAGHLALTMSGDRKMRLWNARTGALLRYLQPRGITFIEDVLGTDGRVALSADGRFALTAGGQDQLARLWDTATGEELDALAHAANVTDVALNADGSLALTADANGTAWLWHRTAPEGEQLYALRGHEDLITSVALSADGTIALTGSQDGTARLWEITIDR